LFEEVFIVDNSQTVKIRSLASILKSNLNLPVNTVSPDFLPANSSSFLYPALAKERLEPILISLINKTAIKTGIKNFENRQEEI